MRVSLLLVMFLFLHNHTYCQSDSDIIFQYSCESVTIRKNQENNIMWYSEKNDRILTYKEEFAVYPDNSYYLIKSKIIIFSSKLFQSDLKEQINVRVDYYYTKTVDGKADTIKIESWGKSYYPTIQKVEKMVDTRSSDNKVTFTMADKSIWIVETGKGSKEDLFYITQKEISYINFALMFSNCKTEIINGKRTIN